ncbi:interleukin-20 receptor subunit beta [Chanos chanos]|uniref:Interleukin-20 receptor subunit beta n=1 Tax=Chanos chanos TaxID=29144 RepID=A0A6J2VFN3_CHACN|nr:interleukin-20 receptor subunit beta-like [Chanos chanos]
MQSVNMRHMLRWRPPQTNCGIVQYSVQFQGEFERLYLNGSWETALDCQQISQHECNLTSDLASDSDYNIRVQAECNNRTSSWASLPAPFNRRDTVLLAPVMSVKVSGDTIQVGFSDLPLSVSVTVDVWRKGNERNVSSHVVTARPSYLSITALQEGATYCLRAQAQLETSTRNKSNNTDTQCVSIHTYDNTIQVLPLPHHSP